MINYLAAEFTKLLKRKNFYICLLCVILASLANVIILLFTHNNYASLTNAEMQYVMMRFVGNKFVAIIVIFITTVFIAGSNGTTIKNAITIGYSRPQIYFSKLILGSVVLFVLIFASMVSTFGFCGIWFYESFTIQVLWEALIRYSMVILIYLTTYTIALTLCFIINYNTLFAIVYFIIFLVLSEIIATTATYSNTINVFSNLTLTHQLTKISSTTTKFVDIYPYILSCFFVYNIVAVVAGVIIFDRKDIR